MYISNAPLKKRKQTLMTAEGDGRSASIYSRFRPLSIIIIVAETQPGK